MPKIRNSINDIILFRCPGCGCAHGVSNQWQYNGNHDSPTITPSIRVRAAKWPTDDEQARILAGEKIKLLPTICHSFVTDGKIQYLSDCTHELAGQTVELPEWD